MHGLTGGRIRQQRLDRGMKQCDLARICGISAAYLNLIEHNRRRIGGKLLQDIARALDVDPVSLSGEADTRLLQQLEAAARRWQARDVAPEEARDLAARFAGWAGIVVRQQQRIGELEHVVETLSDRLSHDPFLFETLHAILSSATAIRATASILTEADDIDPAWQARFQRNLREDAEKLAGQARGLVRHLDGAARAEVAQVSPLDEVESLFAARGWRFPEFEPSLADAAGGGGSGGGGSGGEDATGRAERIARRMAARAPQLSGPAAREMAERWLLCLARDAQALPGHAIARAEAAVGRDPIALARHLGCSPARMLRRLACLPDFAGGAGAAFGLVICDGAGAALLRKPVRDFQQPRFGPACPRWPLFAALARPAQPLVRLIEQPGPLASRFLVFAIAEPQAPGSMDDMPVIEATMLVVPLATAQDIGLVEEGPVAPLLPVGASCRICPRQGCQARREASVLT